MKRFFGIITILIIMTACRPSLIDDFSGDHVTTEYNFPKIFESFWHGMNRNYLFWDIEPGPSWQPVLDSLPSGMRSYVKNNPTAFWDRIYDFYKPQFDELGSVSIMNPNFSAAAAKAYGYLYSMTLGLRDGHFRISFEGSLGMPEIWHSTDRKIMGYFQEDPIAASGVFYFSDLTESTVTYNVLLPQDAFNPDAYFRTYDFVEQVIKPYIDGSFYNEIASDVILDPNMRLAWGEINNSGGGIILYISYNFCMMYDVHNSSSFPFNTAVYDGIRSALASFLDALENPNVRGIIFDIRGNTGGNPADIGFFWGRMINAPLVYAESRSKSGEGRLDYSPWAPVRVMPAPSSEKKLRNIGIPIVMLVEGGTASGAEFIVMGTKAYQNGHVVGTTTAGAASNTVEPVMYNGGAFSGGPFWTRVSGAVVQYRGAKEKIVYEGVGIKPDVEVKMEKADWDNFFKQPGAANSGKDKQLEAAIRVIDPGRTF